MDEQEAINRAVDATISKLRLEGEFEVQLAGVLQERGDAYRAAHEHGLSALAISRQVKARLIDRGVDVSARNLGISHDMVLRAIG